jgi:hypothetical protein
MIIVGRASKAVSLGQDVPLIDEGTKAKQLVENKRRATSNICCDDPLTLVMFGCVESIEQLQYLDGCTGHWSMSGVDSPSVLVCLKNKERR